MRRINVKQSNITGRNLLNNFGTPENRTINSQNTQMKRPSSINTATIKSSKMTGANRP